MPCTAWLLITKSNNHRWGLSGAETPLESRMQQKEMTQKGATVPKMKMAGLFSQVRSGTLT